jgi:hypothetical protein
VRAARPAGVDQVLQALEPVAPAVLEDRHEPATAAGLGCGQLVCGSQRAHERLLAHDVAAGGERGGHLVEVERGRRAQVDDVDVRPLEHLVEAGDGDRPGVAGGGPCRTSLVEVAHRDDPVPGGQLLVRPQVRLADVEADHGNPERLRRTLPAHPRNLEGPAPAVRPSRPEPPARSPCDGSRSATSGCRSTESDRAGAGRRGRPGECRLTRSGSYDRRVARGSAASRPVSSAAASSGGDAPVARPYSPTALPSVTARALAFVAILLGGLCGGLIGYAVTDLQCGTPEVVVPLDADGRPDPDAQVPERDEDDEAGCRTLASVGGLVGAAIGAGGVAIVSVLVLRAMAEWRRELEVDDVDDVDEPAPAGRRPGS